MSQKPPEKIVLNYAPQPYRKRFLSKKFLGTVSLAVGGFATILCGGAVCFHISNVVAAKAQRKNILVPAPSLLNANQAAIDQDWHYVEGYGAATAAGLGLASLGAFLLYSARKAGQRPLQVGPSEPPPSMT